MYNNYTVSKWKATVNMHCSNCSDMVENTEHLIFKCSNVSRIWNILGLTLKFDISWKHIVLGFYHIDSEYIDSLNFIISYIACRIYKYKIFCRVEMLEETEFNLYNHVQNNMKFLYSVLLKVKHTYNMKLIENLIKNLNYCFV